MPSLWRAVPCAVFLVLAAGCGGEDQRTDSITRDAVQDARANLDPALVEQLDRGNAAVREGRHELALQHYRRGLEIDPASAAAWFGVYMSERALGNEQAALEALDRARSLAPGATLLEQGEPETAPSP